MDKKKLKKIAAAMLGPLLPYARRLKSSVTKAGSPGWEDGNGDIQRRKYRTYDEYIEHQRSKHDLVRETMSLGTDYDMKFSAALKERFEKIDEIRPGAAALCMGARFGTEVRSLIELGCFAVGIDLKPGDGNKYVVTGDFHSLQFADESVDVVFTNSIDHALALEKTVSEIARVLKKGGVLVLEVVETAEVPPGDWEASWWKDTDDLVGIFRSAGFDLRSSSNFETPWSGIHMQLVKS